MSEPSRARALSLVRSPGPARLIDVPLEAIRENPAQPRQVFDEEALSDLAASIEQVGVLQPVVVRDVGAGVFELVMGERRVRASRMAGLATVPALVRQVEDSALLRDALLENIQRANLNPLEEAAGYQQMLDDFGFTHDELGKVVGRSRSHVSHMVALLRLPAPVQRRVAVGVLSAGHAKALLGVPDPSVAARLAERIVAEGLSVRSTEELIATGDLPGWEDDHPKARKPRRRPAGRPEAVAYADRLGDRLDTTVHVIEGRTKGRIVIEFAGQDDLDRIMGALSGPDTAAGQ